ncbi:tyrosine-type recombinase/integrase [Pseudomonas sp. FP597]|uniref:site-specific integrase n=1 Tax=Pseudomonas sp. FP597 TaxID=2954096 RepID=UPI0027367C90|nr:site-specific integrase [Pseudomonas sp. FP597]WLI07522.1 tyrosine-type recombinase/integrase [Pseudomonas sp. FP597]
MTTPLTLTEEYIFAHDLRSSSAKIYRASTKALLKHFRASPIEEIDHRAVLGWRKKVLENGLSKRSWNTYSNHLRTVWGYAIEHGLVTHTTINPFRKTSVIPPKRASKTINGDSIQRGRNWLISLVGQERCTQERSKITPAWFWLAVFEMFYYTGIRLNALLCLRYKDIDWDSQMILVRGETEKTHREFFLPIMEGLAPHLCRILGEAEKIGFSPDDQLFNVNRFSRHFHGKEMNIDQVEAMYRKLTDKVGVRMTPHRFRHTLATDLMKQPERNIHLTKSLLNHSNIATTLSYIEVDYDHMRAVLHERSLAQGALSRVRRVDTSGTPQLPLTKARLPAPDIEKLEPKKLSAPKQSSHSVERDSRPIRSTGPSALQKALEYASAQLRPESIPDNATDQISDHLDQSLLLTLMAGGLGAGTFRKHASSDRSMGIAQFPQASP